MYLLKKCDEYNKQFNNTTPSYKEGDKITFKLPGEIYNYHVAKTENNHWILSSDGPFHNDRIFRVLNIVDRVQFCRDISECPDSPLNGMFPEIRCPNSTGISKVINKLMEMCEDKMKESLQKSIFKKGDYVRVIFREYVKDPDCYRFGFVDDMLKYCGDVYIVAEVSSCSSKAGSEPDDGMLYRLKTVAGTLLSYNFASSMLLHTIIVPPQSPFTPSDCVQKIIDSETKTVLKESTPKYKLKFTN